MIRSSLMILLFACSSHFALAESEFHFPQESRGVSELKELVKKQGQGYSVFYHEVNYRKGALFLIMNHNIGSGLSIINTYVYGCSNDGCYLLTMVHAGKNELMGELTPDEQGLVLKSKEGVMYLHMPFNWTEPP